MRIGNLAIRKLTVRFGSLTAVDDVDLDIGNGEVVALLGPSGCGKSTLLRAVAGLEPQAEGTVRRGDEDLARMPVHKRGVGLVFQDGQLFPHRDVAGNIRFGLRMHKINDPGRVDELLDLVGLSGYQRRKVTELSGGEQQRVALARALAPRPGLLLLDEPLSALDRALREQLALDLARMLRKAGTSALVVTHDHDEAFTLADRVALMREGRIVQTGTAEEVWRHPIDEPTATFLGCGLILDARIIGGTARFDLGDVHLPWAPEGTHKIGLRPHALVADPDGPLQGEVSGRVHRRDHVRLLVKLEHREVDAVATIADAPEPGHPVRLRLDPDGFALVGPRERLSVF
ncbi:ABC transporter ATP-binding protein [Kibdelosporangium persicum]|uniref:Spermidine/putrescine import ATP-binding protein PotA n=1 Tax=Kibdelosporangium persicum TaxID=2698649 RepID=A0ABX2F8R4_9PSEU|nr:ABC transporter ATP-binding protein [Kibdelosporangium persicum]NRN67750.1 Spermidine/putrescine import ATP-binding protein PotA [Kibdelosporangium persicum]